MKYYIKSAVILCAVAVVSYFVAQAVIPDRNHVAPQERTRTENREPLVVSDEEVPVVTITKPEAAPTDSSVPISAMPHAKTVTASEIKDVATAKPAAPEPQKRIPQTDMPYKIGLAAICANIVDKAPDGITTKFPKNAPRALFFTHIIGARDTAATIIHRWYLNGKAVQTSVLPVRSPSWRTHSRRNFVLNPDNVGKWKVEAIEPRSGKILETAEFTVE